MNVRIPILLFFLPFCGNAQVEEHPIDVRNAACHAIDSNQTTYGMIECERITREEWREEMDKYYHLLLDTLSTETGVFLKEAQARWVEYSKMEQEFSGALHYYEMEGTMWHVVNAGRATELFRKRALELMEYYHTFTLEGYE